MPRFAHLLGLRRTAGKSADKPDDQREDETDEEYQERKKREEEDAKANAKAEKPDDQGDDETDEEYEKRKKREQDESAEEDDEPKKGKAADGDDDDAEDKEDKKDAKATAARRRERARCAAIFASKHAATRPDMAAHYAFATNLTRREARTALAAVAAGQPQSAGGLAGRMAGMEQLRPGAGAPSGKPSVSSSWDASAKRTGLLPR